MNAADLGAGMFFGASGGDTGASIRGPAALCGVVGKAFEEETVYAAGSAYETETPWHEKRPTL